MTIHEFEIPLRRSIVLACLAAVALLVAVQPGHAQGAAAAAPASSNDRAVMARLDAMGAYLRALKKFSVKAQSSKDEVLVDGQKLQFDSTLEYQVSAPDRLRATFRSDRKHRDFYYDGKTLTEVAPRAGYYASVPLSGTLGELMRAAAQRYDIEMPLADLFLWGTPAAGTEDITLGDACRPGAHQRRRLRPLRAAPAGRGLAGLGRARRAGAAAQDGDHHHRRAVAAAIRRDAEVEPRGQPAGHRLHLRRRPRARSASSSKPVAAAN